MAETTKTADVEALREAAEYALQWLDEAPSLEFQHGADRDVRAKLALALGLDPADHTL